MNYLDSLRSRNRRLVVQLFTPQSLVAIPIVSGIVRLPEHIRSRIEALAVDNPTKFAERAIPALGDRTIEQVLAEENGEIVVAQYLARLEEILGTSRE